MIQVSSVYDAIQGDSYCEFLWGTAHMSICSCVQGDDAQRQGMIYIYVCVRVHAQYVHC